MVLDWYEVTLRGLEDLWVGVLGFIPQLVGALVVFIIGWFVSMLVGKLIADILKRLKFNQLFERDGLKKALEKADVKVDPSEFIGGIFKWAFMIVFLLAAVDILGFDQLGIFLTSVLAYLPNVLIASLIFVVAVIIADVVGKILHATVEGAQMGSGHIVSLIVRWSIWIFTIIAILLQLGVAPFLLQTLFTGVVALIVIAGGISLGLGGKEVAAEWLQDLKRKIRG